VGGITDQRHAADPIAGGGTLMHAVRRCALDGVVGARDDGGVHGLQTLHEELLGQGRILHVGTAPQALIVDLGNDRAMHIVDEKGCAA